MDPRHAVLERLMERYETFAEAEATASRDENWQEATIAHGYCLVLLRAIEAEDQDPAPAFIE